MKLPTEAVYNLSDAINKLHQAARLTDESTSDMIRELADCVEAIKEWGKNEHQ